MALRTASLDRSIAPIHVWAHTPHELQQRAIQLLAHRASAWVVAQAAPPDTGASAQENQYACSHHLSENPAHAPGAAGLDLCPAIAPLSGAGAHRQHRTSVCSGPSSRHVRVASGTHHGP
jgi:hypothetical protein